MQQSGSSMSSWGSGHAGWTEWTECDQWWLGWFLMARIHVEFGDSSAFSRSVWPWPLTLIGHETARIPANVAVNSAWDLYCGVTCGGELGNPMGAAARFYSPWTSFPRCWLLRSWLASGTSQKTRGRDWGGKTSEYQRLLLVCVYLPGAYVSSFFIHGGSSTACFSYCRIRRIHLGRSKTFDIIWHVSDYLID